MTLMNYGKLEFGFFLFLLQICMCPVAFCKTQIYDARNFTGLVVDVDATEECTTRRFGAAESIYTDECILVYKLKNCKNTYDSLQLLPGYYYNLDRLEFEGITFMDQIWSYRKCGEDMGGEKIHVTFYSGVNYTGDVLFEYFDIRDEISLPNSDSFGKFGSFDNHGNCVRFLLEDYTFHEFTGGSTEISRNSSSFFGGSSRSISPCLQYKYNLTVVSFNVSEDKSRGDFRRFMLPMGVTATFINDGLAKVTQEYKASVNVTESFEIIPSDDLFFMNNVKVENRADINFSEGIPHIAKHKVATLISRAMPQQRALTILRGKPDRKNITTEFSVSQKIEIEASSKYQVNASVLMSEGFLMKYTFVYEVTGMYDRRRLEASEIRERLGKLNFIRDKDNFTVIASEEGKISMDFGVESVVSGKGEKLSNSGNAGERLGQFSGYWKDGSNGLFIVVRFCCL